MITLNLDAFRLRVEGNNILINLVYETEQAGVTEEIGEEKNIVSIPGARNRPRSTFWDLELFGEARPGKLVKLMLANTKNNSKEGS